MLRILAIGNSFSQDAAAYFHELAQSGGVDTEIINLYIGGCSLETHWSNALKNEEAYAFEQNGRDTGRMVSLTEVLTSGHFDVVTLQQASALSGLIDSYEPYLSSLSALVRQHQPQAKLLIHQTWAYEIDSTHPGFASYDNNQQTMYEKLCAAYQKAARDIDAACIPVGDVVQALRQSPYFNYAHGGQSLCRDGFHLDFLYGRYAAAAAWVATLLGDISAFPYAPPCDEDSNWRKKIDCIRETVANICRKGGVHDNA